MGIASNIPHGDGKYDDLGYDTVIPIRFGTKIINKKKVKFEASKIEFIEFEGY